MTLSLCKNCKRQIQQGLVIPGEWAHHSGSRYCLDKNGYTATPIKVAAPVLETEVL